MIVPRDYAGQRQLWEQLSQVFGDNGPCPPGPEPTACPTPWPSPTPWPQPTACPTPWPSPTPWPQPTPWPTPPPCSKAAGGVWNVWELEDIRAWTRESFPGTVFVDSPATIGAPASSLWLPLQCWDFEFHMDMEFEAGVNGGFTLGIYILDYEGKIKGQWMHEVTTGRNFCFLRTVTIARKSGSPAMWIFMGSSKRLWSVDLIPGKTGKVWVHLPMFSDAMFARPSNFMILWRNGCGDTDWVNHGY